MRLSIAFMTAFVVLIISNNVEGQSQLRAMVRNIMDDMNSVVTRIGNGFMRTFSIQGRERRLPQARPVRGPPPQRQPVRNSATETGSVAKQAPFKEHPQKHSPQREYEDPESNEYYQRRPANTHSNKQYQGFSGYQKNRRNQGNKKTVLDEAVDTIRNFLPKRRFRSRLGPKATAHQEFE